MLLMKSHPESFFTEEYRTLKTSLEYSSVDKKLKTIAITSANPSEGKSTITSNLSYALAQNGTKVIIIDCDLRKPTIHKKFLISNERGVTDVLIGKVKLEKAIINIKKDIDILTSGSKAPNPSEMLSSKAMEELIERLKGIYDYILIDTPPIKNISDGQILAAKCDGTILVVKAESTKAQDVVRGYEALSKVKANIVGTIMNSVKRKKEDYYYYYE